MSTHACGRASFPVGFTALALLSVLSGCGDGGFQGPDMGEAESAMTVCAAGPTVEGIDVSKWQANIDWATVGQSGIEFAIARAAYGTSIDTYFGANWDGIAAVGLVRGAYQYFLPDQDAIAQANTMLAAIGTLGPGDLPPVIDVEETGGMSAAVIESKISQWIAHVEAAVGRKPIIYTGKYFWQDYVGSSAFSSYPLWVPNYSFSCPNLPDGYWDDWIMFQYSSTGSIPGIAGNVDLDQFNGNLQDLLDFADGGPDWGAQFVSQSFPYASQGNLVMYAGDTVDVTIEMRNIGTQPWDSNTRLATTEPRDRVSVFAGPEWPAPDRYAQVSGTVPPGGTYAFTFTLHAPAQPGIYDEHFGLVQEGVAWFSDPGQGGPPDTQLEGVFEVLAAMAGAGGGSAASSSGAGGTNVTTGGWGDGGGSGEPGANDASETAGCSCSLADRSSPQAGLYLLVGLGLLGARRRPRASRPHRRLLPSGRAG